MLLATDQFAWGIFRFGPKMGEAWPDQQFPIDHVDELYKQVVPDLILTEVPSLGQQFASPASDNPSVINMATLAKELNGAILVGHSQTSPVPTQAALKQMGGIKGLIQLETGCFANLTSDQVKVLAKIPTLVMVGDHWDLPQPPSDCKTEMQQINGAGGDFTFIYLPDLGMRATATCSCRTRTTCRSPTSSSTGSTITSNIRKSKMTKQVIRRAKIYTTGAKRRRSRPSSGGG